MADNTQGKATQKDPGAGQGRGATADAGAAAARTRDTDEARRARAEAPARAARDGEDKRPTADEIEKREPKTYRATDRGYADGRVIEPGEVFTTKIDKGSWMEPVKKSELAYGVDAAVDEAGYGKKADVDYEGMGEPALQALAALVGVTKPGELSKDELITAIRAARIPQAQ